MRHSRRFRPGAAKACSNALADGYGDKDSEPITVIAGQTTDLKIGPPFSPKFTVEAKDKVALLGLEIRGAGNEKITEIGGDSPPKPKFTITDPQGKVVEQGDFEYG